MHGTAPRFCMSSKMEASKAPKRVNNGKEKLMTKRPKTPYIREYGS